MVNHKAIISVVALSSCLIIMSGCGPEPGKVLDEALQVDVKAEDLPGSADDYLRDMDRGWNKDQVFDALAEALDFTPEQLSEHFSKDIVWDSYNKGRNNWVVWTGGNDRLWDFLSNNTFGAFDLLKTLSSHPNIRYCGNTKDVDGYRSEANEGSATYPKDGPYQYPKGYLLYEDDNCTGEDRTWYMASRANRWKYFGLVNEPGFKMWDPKGCDWTTDKKTSENPYGNCGDPDRHGLWLDQRVGPPDPFEDESKYPGVAFKARQREGFRGSYYGYGTGIVGLRLFPNPDFDEKAAKKWDPVRYYNDPTYYEDKDLVRPYRVGMSCAFCHVGPSPIDPPEDYENPEWKNLTSNPGAQYFWIDRIFFWNPKGRHENFVYQLFHTSLPGSLDTSLVSSDNINNPRTMNAVYSIPARMDIATKVKEKLTGGELNNRQFNDYDRTRLLSRFFQPPDTVFTPHVLKDGADSVGVLGALNRVYINIGLFSEEWLLHFKPLLGGRITPIEIAVLEKNSTYWNANVAQTPDLALFFLASAHPDFLKDAPGGEEIMEKVGREVAKKHGFPSYEKLLNEGKLVFAENCARCHSGKQPDNLCPLGSPCKKDEIIENSAGYFNWMRKEVQKPDFLIDNFLSTDRRIPVTELGTNACSPLATNGLRGDIWNDFTSTTYKELPAVGKVTVHHPKTGEPWEYEMPGGGRGYTRPASLISLWSTAPFLLNNSVGNFYGAATVKARLASFDDSIQKMLWPEKRLRDDESVEYLRYYASDREDFRGYKGLGNIPGYIQRTTATSYFRVPASYLPDPLDEVVGMSRFLPKIAPWLFSEREWGVLQLGPIPAGTPVSLVASLPPVSESTRLKDKAAHAKKLIRFLGKAVKDLKSLDKDASDEKAREVFGDLVDPLVELSKCPDYVVNRGHYFGSNLSDEDKWALIEFLKTF